MLIHVHHPALLQIVRFNMSSKEHFETLQAYKVMDRMDAHEAKTGTTPAYQTTGIVDLGWTAPSKQSSHQGGQAKGSGDHGKK